MAFLVRRWRERRARRWELNELGPYEYPASPHLQRLFGAAGCLGSAPTVRFVGVEDMDGAVGWETHSDRAWMEWRRRGKRKGWKAAMRDPNCAVSGRRSCSTRWRSGRMRGLRRALAHEGGGRRLAAALGCGDGAGEVA
eukprot:6547298-Prymnesium_polylepis.1